MVLSSSVSNRPPTPAKHLQLQNSRQPQTFILINPSSCSSYCVPQKALKRCIMLFRVTQTAVIGAADWVLMWWSRRWFEWLAQSDCSQCNIPTSFHWSSAGGRSIQRRVCRFSSTVPCCILCTLILFIFVFKCGSFFCIMCNVIYILYNHVAVHFIL